MNEGRSPSWRSTVHCCCSCSGTLSAHRPPQRSQFGRGRGLWPCYKLPYWNTQPGGELLLCWRPLEFPLWAGPSPYLKFKKRQPALKRRNRAFRRRHRDGERKKIALRKMQRVNINLTEFYHMGRLTRQQRMDKVSANSPHPCTPCCSCTAGTCRKRLG